MRLTDTELRALLDEHGWQVSRAEYGWRADSPFMRWRHRTPEYALRAGWWPGETYATVRQIWWCADGSGRRYYQAIREAGAPWVAVTERRATNTALATYVAQWGRAACEVAMTEEAERLATGAPS